MKLLILSVTAGANWTTRSRLTEQKYILQLYDLAGGIPDTHRYITACGLSVSCACTAPEHIPIINDVMTRQTQKTSLMGIDYRPPSGSVMRPRAGCPRRLLMTCRLAIAKAGRRQPLTTTNMNYELREILLEPYYDKGECGGLRYFTCLPSNVLNELINRNYVEMEEWNCCDGVTKLFLPFLHRNPQFTAHGYAVMPSRKDIRVTIEGVERSAVFTVDEIIDFATTFRGADEMDLAVDYARCWYD